MFASSFRASPCARAVARQGERPGCAGTLFPRRHAKRRPSLVNMQHFLRFPCSIAARLAREIETTPRNDFP
jgi:hypothetical protein